MTLSRRKTLALIGGGTILAASAAAGGFTATRRPDKALMPWERAGEYEDIRHFALSYAILAPNPHNRQPWLVELKGENRIVLYRDTTRELEHTDPFQRQLVIGLGCFLELMRIAAAERGFAVDLQIYPEGEDGPVAIADFSEGAQKDLLFSQILGRRTCRKPFADTAVPSEMVDALSGYGEIITQFERVAEIRELTWQAMKVESETPRTLSESIDLLRLGKAEINANPDGISLGGPLMETLVAFGVVTRHGQRDPSSKQFATTQEMFRDIAMATPAYAVIKTGQNTRRGQIDAGRRWVRLNLATTGLGLSLHPVSQALQEYSEMAEHYTHIHEMLAEPGETVQMLGRLGYGPDVAQSPRWPLETRMLNG